MKRSPLFNRVKLRFGDVGAQGVAPILEGLFNKLVGDIRRVYDALFWEIKEFDELWATAAGRIGDRYVGKTAGGSYYVVICVEKNIWKRVNIL